MMMMMEMMIGRILGACSAHPLLQIAASNDHDESSLMIIKMRIMMIIMMKEC